MFNLRRPIVIKITGFSLNSFSITSQFTYNIISICFTVNIWYSFYLNIKGISREEVFSLVTLFIYSRDRYVTGYSSLRKPFSHSVYSGSKPFTALMR